MRRWLDRWAPWMFYLGLLVSLNVGLIFMVGISWLMIIAFDAQLGGLVWTILRLDHRARQEE